MSVKHIYHSASFVFILAEVRSTARNAHPTIRHVIPCNSIRYGEASSRHLLPFCNLLHPVSFWPEKPFALRWMTWESLTTILRPRRFVGLIRPCCSSLLPQPERWKRPPQLHQRNPRTARVGAPGSLVSGHCAVMTAAPVFVLGLQTYPVIFPGVGCIQMLRQSIHFRYISCRRQGCVNMGLATLPHWEVCHYSGRQILTDAPSHRPLLLLSPQMGIGTALPPGVFLGRKGCDSFGCDTDPRGWLLHVSILWALWHCGSSSGPMECTATPAWSHLTSPDQG